MKYLAVIILLAISTIAYSQTVQEVWVHSIDNEGFEEKQYHVFDESRKLVGKFFPSQDNDEQTRKRAEDFAKKFKPVIINETKPILRKKETKNK